MITIRGIDFRLKVAPNNPWLIGAITPLLEAWVAEKQEYARTYFEKDPAAKMLAVEHTSEVMESTCGKFSYWVQVLFKRSGQASAIGTCRPRD